MTHSSAIYVFDGIRRGRVLVSSLATAQPDIAGAAADIKRLVEEADPPGYSNGCASWCEPGGYLPAAPRTGKLAAIVPPSSKRSVTGTELPGIISFDGDMHIR